MAAAAAAAVGAASESKAAGTADSAPPPNGHKKSKHKKSAKPKKSKSKSKRKSKSKSKKRAKRRKRSDSDSGSSNDSDSGSNSDDSSKKRKHRHRSQRDGTPPTNGTAAAAATAAAGAAASVQSAEEKWHNSILESVRLGSVIRLAYYVLGDGRLKVPKKAAAASAVSSAPNGRARASGLTAGPIRVDDDDDDSDDEPSATAAPAAAAAAPPPSAAATVPVVVPPPVIVIDGDGDDTDWDALFQRTAASQASTPVVAPDTAAVPVAPSALASSSSAAAAQPALPLPAEKAAAKPTSPLDAAELDEKSRRRTHKSVEIVDVPSDDGGDGDGGFDELMDSDPDDTAEQIRLRAESKSKSAVTAGGSGDAGGFEYVRFDFNRVIDTKTGMTLLDWSAALGHADMTEWLLEHATESGDDNYRSGGDSSSGLDVNIQHPITGMTALHHAVLGRHHAVCWALCHAGANAELRNATGQSPIDLGLAELLAAADRERQAARAAAVGRASAARAKAAADSERAWNEKLAFESGQESYSAEESYAAYDRQQRQAQHREDAKRWEAARAAAAATAERRASSASAAAAAAGGGGRGRTVQTNGMTEDEWTNYIFQLMSERRRMKGSERDAKFAFLTPEQRLAAKTKAEAKRREAERDDAIRQKIAADEYAKEQPRLKRVEAEKKETRLAWAKRWAAFEARNLTANIKFDDIPFPYVPDAGVSAAAAAASSSMPAFTAASGAAARAEETRGGGFLWELLDARSTLTAAERKSALRDAYLRWHPDRFGRQFGSALADSDRGRITERVLRIAQYIASVKEQAKTL